MTQPDSPADLCQLAEGNSQRVRDRWESFVAQSTPGNPTRSFASLVREKWNLCMHVRPEQLVIGLMENRFENLHESLAASEKVGALYEARKRDLLTPQGAAARNAFESQFLRSQHFRYGCVALRNSGARGPVSYGRFAMDFTDEYTSSVRAVCSASDSLSMHFFDPVETDASPPLFVRDRFVEQISVLDDVPMIASLKVTDDLTSNRDEWAGVLYHEWNYVEIIFNDRKGIPRDAIERVRMPRDELQSLLNWIHEVNDPITDPGTDEGLLQLQLKQADDKSKHVNLLALRKLREFGIPFVDEFGDAHEVLFDG